MEEITNDPRFAHVPKDPKFRRIPKSERKVKIDRRFQSMFKDKKFKVTYTIDKRGRPIQKSSTEDLEKYYDISSESEGDEHVGNDKQKCIKIQPRSRKSEIMGKNQSPKNDKAESFDGNEGGYNVNNSDDCKDNASEQSNVDVDALMANENELKIIRKNESNKLDTRIKMKLKDLSIDYARGEGALLSDSSSDEESSQESEMDEGIEHMWGELDKEAETTDQVSSRLAVCNMDWDRIRAVDLMVLFNSFLPPGGLIHSVIIYPSEFGMERMKEEEIKGPTELGHVNNDMEERDQHCRTIDAAAAAAAIDDDDDEEEGSEFKREKLRQYQLNRLKYYYGVIVCDSPETANKIYTECDGHEYESTATKMDLRFIPQNMEFDREPREVCHKLPDMSKYQPRQFTTTALQQVKVECTWDETKLDRQEITKKINTGKIDDIDENDIKAYLASGTSDEESDAQDENKETSGGVDNQNGKNSLSKYKLLLRSIEQQEEEKKKKEGELEFTWGLGAKEKAEKFVQEKVKKSEKLTPFQQYLDKRKEKKKAKRDGKKKLKGGDGKEEAISESEESLPSDIDISDPYFADEFKNGQFLEDKSKASKREQRKKKMVKSKNKADKDEEESQGRAELELLLLDEEGEQEKNHFDMRKIEESELLTKSKRKRLLKKKKQQKESTTEDDFRVNVEDPRFNALFTSHHFNIDPADPHYKKTRGTEALVNEKLKRRANNDAREEVVLKHHKSGRSDKMSADLVALVKSIKRNTKNISKPIK